MSAYAQQPEFAADLTLYNCQPKTGPINHLLMNLIIYAQKNSVCQILDESFTNAYC